MDRRAAVRAAVASVLWVPADGLTPDTPLGPTLQGSLGQARLAAALRPTLGDIRPPAGLTTVGELEAALCGADGATVAAPIPIIAAPTTTGPACGVDIEAVAALPVVADYWEDEFYRGNFAPAEIAYCAVQAQPPMHFAARWCAQEALKKMLAAAGAGFVRRGRAGRTTDRRRRPATSRRRMASRGREHVAHCRVGHRIGRGAAGDRSAGHNA